MRISAALTAIGLVLAIVPVLSLDTTSAWPKCNIASCVYHLQPYSRDAISKMCQQHGGIELGTNAESGSYGCYDEADKGDEFIECDENGQCIGGGGSASRTRVRKGPGLNDMLRRGATRP